MWEFLKINNPKLSKKSNLIFYIGMLAIPVIQFILMYVVVNFNSFLLAVQEFDGISYSFIGFDNFKQVFHNLANQDELLASAANSITYYFISLFFSTFLSVLFSFYIYKKKFASDFFRLMLFIPSILSSIIMAVIFKYMADRAIPQMVDSLFGKQFQGLFADPKYMKGTIFFYNVWIGFGASILVYSGTMKEIPESIVEAAKLDGITPFKEFWFITIPCIYPTFVTFIVAGVAGIFTNQLNLFSFFGETISFEYQTFGYYLYNAMYKKDPYSYPYLAALGLTFSFIAIPITLIMRKLLFKFGPSES